MTTARVVCEDIHVRQVVFKMATFIVNQIFGPYKDGFRKFSSLWNFKVRLEVNWSLHFTMAEIEIEKIDETYYLIRNFLFLCD